MYKLDYKDWMRVIAVMTVIVLVLGVLIITSKIDSPPLYVDMTNPAEFGTFAHDCWDSGGVMKESWCSLGEEGSDHATLINCSDTSDMLLVIYSDERLEQVELPETFQKYFSENCSVDRAWFNLDDYKEWLFEQGRIEEE